MKKNLLLISIVLMTFLMMGCSSVKKDLISTDEPKTSSQENIVENKDKKEDSQINLPTIETPVEIQVDEKIEREEMINVIMKRYGEKKPSIFGENIPGVYTKIKTNEKILALTFDACGGKYGSDIDEELITYLIEEQIPATLFINARWMKINQEFFLKLSTIPFFDVQNHGMEHKPLSTTGESIYGISGTNNLEEVLNEVLGQQENMEVLTGKIPKLFRSGTAYYDDVAVAALNDLGVKVVNFSILGDAGATYTVQEMVNSAESAKSGDILLYHMNHPKKDVAKGIKKVIPMLKEKGFRFVKLIDYEESLE